MTARLKFHPYHIVVEHAVERIEEANRIGFAVGKQRSHRALRHHCHDSALETVTSHVTDPELDVACRFFLKHVVIVAADFACCLHVGGDVERFDAAQLL